MPGHYELVREALAATIAGAMAACTGIISILQETPLQDVTDGQWLTIGIGGFLAAASGWKQLLSRPPKRFD